MVVACFDVGGTGLKAAFIDSEINVHDYQYIQTPDSLEEMLVEMDLFIVKRDITAISISFPGAINYKTGYIEGLSAVPYIHGVSWYELLSEYNVPVYLENDANCVGLSELAENKDIQNCACVVIGTGIGGALIINRHLVKGKKSYGGEFGYMMLQNMRPSIKNWSQIASTGSLVRFVNSQADQKYHNLNGKDIFDLANNGDSVCNQAIDTMVENLCQGLLNIYYCIDPDAIYLGGSISQDIRFIEKVKLHLEKLKNEFPNDLPEVPIVEACRYGANANLIGAYVNTLQ